MAALTSETLSFMSGKYRETRAIPRGKVREEKKSQ